MDEYQFMITSQQKMIESQQDLIKALRETIAAKDAKIEALHQGKALAELEVEQLKRKLEFAQKSLQRLVGSNRKTERTEIEESFSNGWSYS